MGTPDREAKAAPRRWPAIALGMTLLLLSALVPGAAAQDSDIDFLVEPAEGSQLAESGGYYLIAAKPGSQVVQTLALRNDSSRPLPLRLQAVDATTGPYGGASYGLPGEVPKRVGTWIELDRRSVMLPAGGSALVDFRVNVPADTGSGQHLAGLAVWSPASENEGQAAGNDEAGATIAVQTRRVIAVQVNLPGPARADLVVSRVEAAARPDGLYLEIGIANEGNALTKGTGEIVLPTEDVFETFDIDTFVPGTEIAYPVRWTLSAPEGEYAARVLIEYEGGETTWEGTVVVGEGVRSELADRGVDVPGAAIPAWLWAAGAAVGIVALALAFFLVGRRRGATGAARAPTRRPARAPSTAAPSAGPPPVARSAPGPGPRTAPPPPPPPPPARTMPPPG